MGPKTPAPEQRFFSPRENQNPFRELFWQFSGFHPWNCFSFRENIIKTARENTRCVRENFFQITYVKMGTCVREKYNLLFPWNLAKFTFFCTREKKILFRENYQNFAILFPWKRKSIREKIQKCVRENFRLPVKMLEKVCVKATFPSVKKIKKRPKIAFTGTFDFHGKKKTLGGRG